ncbi:hypothetical protein GSD1FS_1974 [Bifidobacterium sp. GSD1FS]|uniref:Uncharacterized protein n=1 Tax=Bifidobacterium canis TaxID=2610880 RepID=A0A7K1J7J2_9BIFI|nr:hypothetical protein [Bifidobacterium canis]
MLAIDVLEIETTLVPCIMGKAVYGKHANSGSVLENPKRIFFADDTGLCVILKNLFVVNSAQFRAFACCLILRRIGDNNITIMERITT